MNSSSQNMQPPKNSKRVNCLVNAFGKVGTDLQNAGLLTGLGGGVVTAFAPEAVVGEAAVGAGVSLYAAGSALKDSVSITNLVFNGGNGTGYIVSQVNSLVLNQLPEGLGRNLVENALDQAEEKAGLEKGDAGVCGGG